MTVALRECISGGWSYDWEDLGANGRADFREQCREDWNTTSQEMQTREVEQALETCEALVEEVPDWSCEELRALYID